MLFENRHLLRTAVLTVFLSVTIVPAADRGADVTSLPHYRNHKALMVYIDEEGKERPVKTPDHWGVRRRHVLLGMQEAMGRLPARDKLPPLDVQVKERVTGEGYERLTITFVVERTQAAKADRVTAYLYIPIGIPAGQKRPAMLALHPTHRIGKGVVDGQSERPNRAYAQELAQRGYVVIAPQT